MNYILSIITGIVFAYAANYILDYLPYQRGLTGKKVRSMDVVGDKKDTRKSLFRKDLPSVEKIFSSVSFPFCSSCLESKRWFDYFLGKKCDICGTGASWRFRILLLIMPIMFLILLINPVEGFRIVDIYLLIVFYVIIFFMDMEHRVILVPVTYAGILFGVYFGLNYHTFVGTILGGIAGGGIMLLFYWIGILYIRFVRKTSDPNMYEVALGFGDVTLSLILGLILGWPGILGGLFIGILLGGLVSGGLLIGKFLTKKYAPNDLILPYAPFLVIGAFLIMVL
jgi:leader peptidase (prepilin peptidase)/N-methyltransferase